VHKQKIPVMHKPKIPISEKPKTPIPEKTKTPRLQKTQSSQEPEIDQDIINYDYKAFMSNHDLGHPVSLKDFTEAYLETKNEWLDNMGEYLGESDYEFDDQQQQLVINYLITNYPDKYTYDFDQEPNF